MTNMNDIICGHKNILNYILQKQTFHLPTGSCILSVAVDTSLNLAHSKSLSFQVPSQQVILSRDVSFFPQNPAWGVFPFLLKKCVYMHVVLLDIQELNFLLTNTITLPFNIKLRGFFLFKNIYSEKVKI